MESRQPESLTEVKTEWQGLTHAIVYATDPHGDVWVTRSIDGVVGEWRLFKKAEEIAQPTLSWEQMVERAKAQQEFDKGPGYVN